jgi:hypothetical protein
MKYKASLLSRTLLVIAVVLLIPVNELAAQQDKVAAFKQSLGMNQKMLAQFQWIETTIISVKGEEKSRIQKQCFYGPDGKVVKQQTSASPPPESKGGLRGRAIEKKKAEISDYMKDAVALVQQYVPPDQQRIQAAKEGGNIALSPVGAATVRLDIKNYLKPNDNLSITIDTATNAIQKISVKSYLDAEKDAVTLDVTFAILPGGIYYPAATMLVAPEKKVQVNVQNADYSTR